MIGAIKIFGGLQVALCSRKSNLKKEIVVLPGAENNLGLLGQRPV